MALGASSFYSSDSVGGGFDASVCDGSYLPIFFEIGRFPSFRDDIFNPGKQL